MQQAFQYKLYPSKDQQARLQEHLEICRHLYNNALGERIDAWKHKQHSIHHNQQQNQLPVLKQKDVSLEGVYSQVLQDVLRCLDRAYQNFFRRVKAGQEPGFPRFKGIGRYRSLTYPQWGTGVQIKGDQLVLSKIGELPIRLHRPLEGTPKTCTITHKADGWHASIVCDLEPNPLPKTEQEVGVDVGIETFATLSGEHPSVANPRHLQKAQKHLRMCQRRLERRSRRDKDGRLLPRQSQRRQKAKVVLAKAHQKVAHARKDFHHKVARVLVERFDVICIEKLSINNMLKNHHLARHIADGGWGQFFEILKSKAASAVKIVVEVCPRNTSQNCSQCGEYVPKALSARLHSCPYCGLELHRDKNAAENIKKVGRDAACSRQRSAMAQA